MSSAGDVTIGVVLAALVTAAPARAEDPHALAEDLAREVADAPYPDTRISAEALLSAPFGRIGGEAVFQSTGFLVPALLLEARVGGAGWSASGEWARGKVGFSYRRYHDDLGHGMGAGVSEHALYVPVEFFNVAPHNQTTSTAFFNTGLGYRYDRTTSDAHSYVMEVEVDYALGRGGDRNGLGFLAAVEYGREHLFMRIEAGVFPSGKPDDFSSTFRMTFAVGWHFANLHLGSTYVVPPR